MRGGLVALGIIFMVLGVAWIVPVLVGGATLGLGGAIAGLCFWFILAPIFFIVGLAVFIAGLVAEPPETRTALQAGPTEYYPPVVVPPRPMYQGPPINAATVRPVSRKLCPTCGNVYQPDYRICPRDGAELRTVE